MERNQPPRAFIQRRPKARGVERLLTAATSAQEAAQLARLCFDSGVTDFLIVLDAEREVLNTRDQLAQSQTDTATALISVYRPLAGLRSGPSLPGKSSRRAVCCASCSRSCRVRIESGFFRSVQDQWSHWVFRSACRLADSVPQRFS